MNSSNKKVIIIICSVICILLITGSVFLVTKHFYENKIEELEEEQSNKKKKNNAEEKETENLLDKEVIKEYTFEIPDVKGLDKDKATEKIIQSFATDNKSLTVKIDISVESGAAGLPAGQVIQTEPAIGSKIKVSDNSKVSIVLYIDSGPSSITIENYVGKNYLEVKGMLEAYGIKVIVEKKAVANSLNYKEGTIIEQSVSAGEKLEAKDEITLYIPNVEVKYPDFTDKENPYTEEDVRKFCDMNNIKLEIEYKESSSSPGTIIAQSRPKGTNVVSGTSLKITIAS